MLLCYSLMSPKSDLIYMHLSWIPLSILLKLLGYIAWVREDLVIEWQLVVAG